MISGQLPDALSIVTGGGSGIGAATVRRLAKRQKVLAIGRTAEKLETLAREVGEAVIPWPMDVSDRKQVHDLRNRLRSAETTVNGLVNNAGFARSGAAELSLEELQANWDAVIATNLSGAFLMSMAVAPSLKRPGGRIINISSVAAYSGGRYKGSTIYAASKAGLHGLSAGLAREFGEDGITVNTIAPGLIAQTEFTSAWPQSLIDGFVEDIPVGRPGCADEVAALIEFLCGEDAGYITGEVINQNGGVRFGG